MKNNLLGGLAIILVIVLGVLVFFRPTSSTPPPYGSAGPDQYAFANFFGGMTVGQGSTASSTNTSVTLKGNEFINADTLAYTINQGPTAILTLPASTTQMCASIPKGQRRVVVIRNATTTAASALTLAAGTGFTLASASSTFVIDGSTSAQGLALLTIVRLPTTDCAALMQPSY